MEKEVAQAAFDAIMKLSHLLMQERKTTDEEHEMAQSAARDLIPYM